MSTSRNDTQRHDDDLTGIRRKAETLRESQERDFARYRANLAAEAAELHATFGAIISAESAPPGGAASDVATDGANDAVASEADGHTTSRRTLLKWGGVGAAAALAAAGGVSLSSPTADASDGDTLILGAASKAEHTTEIAYDGSETSPTVFRASVAASNSTAVIASPGAVASNLTLAVTGMAGTDGRGVRGDAPGNTAFGVWGASDSGYGVVGESDTGIGLTASGTGRLYQAQSGSVGAPASGAYATGEQIRDSVGNLYICVSGGSPGVWQKVVGQPVGYGGGAIHFLPTPIRVYDSRPSNRPLVGSDLRNVQVAGVNIGGVQVPSGATGCVGNLTVTRPTASGYLVIYPAGSRTPSSSTVNFVAGQSIPNSFWVGLSGGGQVTVHSFQSGSCHFIVDITGYIS